jgi:hypothetical protein
MEDPMISCCEFPNLDSNFQQAHADRHGRPNRQIVSTLEEIIKTGGLPA